MFDRKKCSPEDSDNPYSCMDDDIIIDIARIINREMNAGIDLKQCPRVVQQQICEKLNKPEHKLLDMHNIIDKLPKSKLKRFRESFRPEMPDEWSSDYNTWLTTTDIDEVMKQYERDDKSLYYCGAVPMDFAQCEFPNKLCRFNLSKLLKRGKTKIAIVFNTDDHDESGEHWISMYIDCKGKNLDRPCIYFHDSAGSDPPQEVMDFVERVKQQGKRNGIIFTFLQNDRPHQTGSTECGIYCLHFLIYMIQNGDFMKYIRNRKGDKYIEKYRKIFFID